MKLQKTVNYDGKTKTNIFKFVKYSKLKELVTALKRTPRRDIYSDQEKMKIYHTLTSREFSGNIENREDISNFVQITLTDLNTPKREQYFNEKGFLKGTLDEDGNTRDHTKEQSKIGKKYGPIDREAGVLSEDEYNLLIVALDLHDNGEAARGDVVYDNKTINNEDFERKCGEIIIDSILKDEYKQNGIYKHVQEAYDINFNKDHHLHIFFKTYEIFSYLKGAIIATKNNEISYAYWLVHNVLINQIKKLPALKQTIPSAKFFLKEYEKEIDKLFDFVEQSEFFHQPIPNGKSQEEYMRLFTEAKTIRENQVK